MKSNLGLVELPESATEPDFEIQLRYQNFSAELLRLSLLGISGLGFIAFKYVFPANGESSELPGPVTIWIAVGLLALGVSSVAALVHRYVSVDSLSWHLQALRHELRNEAGDLEASISDRKKRYIRFKISGWAIIVSSASLAVGAISTAIAFFCVV